MFINFALGLKLILNDLFIHSLATIPKKVKFEYFTFAQNLNINKSMSAKYHSKQWSKMVINQVELKTVFNQHVKAI